jgi:hypothetical protein
MICYVGNGNVCLLQHVVIWGRGRGSILIVPKEKYKANSFHVQKKLLGRLICNSLWGLTSVKMESPAVCHLRNH